MLLRYNLSMTKTEREHVPADKRLAEVALKVTNMEAMTNFYETAMQLRLLRKEPHMAFLEIPGGFKGHTSILALFKRKTDEVQGALDHIAFSIDLKDYEREKERLERLGFTVRTSQHNWVQWRSLYVNDPEGNEVELVCFDPSIPKNFDS